MRTEEAQAERDNRAAPVGVQGWLLFLCIVLTFLYPATSFYQILFRIIPKIVSSHGRERAVLLGVYSVVFIAVAILSVAAGLKLWLIKNGAVKFARLWLMTYLLVNFGYFLFWMAITHPIQPVRFAEMGWYHVVGPTLPFTLWYFYLEHSRRVRATYSA